MVTVLVNLDTPSCRRDVLRSPVVGETSDAFTEDHTVVTHGLIVRLTITFRGSSESRR